MYIAGASSSGFSLDLAKRPGALHDVDVNEREEEVVVVECGEEDVESESRVSKARLECAPATAETRVLERRTARPTSLADNISR